MCCEGGGGRAGRRSRLDGGGDREGGFELQNAVSCIHVLALREQGISNERETATLQKLFVIKLNTVHEIRENENFVAGN